MFEKGDAPIYCTQIQEDNPTDAVRVIKDVARRGTHAVGLQLCVLEPKYRTEKDIRTVLQAAGDLPVYLTDYQKFDRWGQFPWEQKAEELLLGAGCGAALVDIPGNMFSVDEFELTYEDEAVKKQKELIKQLHGREAKALISSHILKFTEQNEVLKVALAQQSRGADVIKIVTACDTDEELVKNLEITRVLQKTLDRPFIFVSGGKKGRFHRMVGPYLGSCLWFCAPKYGKYDTKAQPLLEVVQNVDRNFYLDQLPLAES